MRLAALGLGVVLCPLFAGTAIAGLNTWGAHTGVDVAAVTPFFYAYDDRTVAPSIFVSAGVSERVDLIAGMATTFDFSGTGGDVAQLASVELMPRFFITDEVGLALHSAYFPSDQSVMLSPAVHAVGQWGRFMLTANVGWQPTIADGGFDPGRAFAILVPEVRVAGTLTFFTEVNPGVAFDGAGTVDLTVVPGIGFAFGEGDAHAMALGVQVGVMPTTTLSGGLWYSTAWGG